MEEERRKENMEKLRKDMEKSCGETVVLSTGLKDRPSGESLEIDEDEDEEIEDANTDDFIDEDEEEDDEDEEVGRFPF